MPDTGQSLTERIGSGSAAIVAAAYDQAVSILSFGDRLYVPSRAARIDMIRAMILFGTENGFDQDRLTLAALAAARPDLEPGPKASPSTQRERSWAVSRNEAALNGTTPLGFR